MKNHKLSIIYLIILIIFTVYVVLDTFVFSSVYTVTQNKNTKKINSGDVTLTDNSYSDDNIEINIKEYRENDTTIYVADVVLKDNSLLKTAFANNSYGKNITAKTSSISESVKAILSVNGDYYGVQEKGYVLKNGNIYRNTSSGNEDLVIYKDGSFEIVNEDDVSLESLVSKGAYNVLSFGPALIIDGDISISKNEEVGKAMASNPRTAIGKISDNHYVFVVSDGRTSDSEGLSLYELASFMKSLGCDIAYNLDGGGSSTMYFNGKVINNTVGGRGESERSVSDIVYIGY
ncbi:MAG: phosphodiester glycosidase family protein [Bacilli bacterium]|nr:phosphodiester glycosidase family protein [Bacilli bacterium]